MSIESGTSRDTKPNHEPRFDIIQDLAGRQAILDSCDNEFDQLSFAASDIQEVNETIQGTVLRIALRVSAIGVCFQGDNRIGTMERNDGQLITLIGSVAYADFGLVTGHKGFVLCLNDLDMQILDDSGKPVPIQPVKALVPISRIKEYDYVPSEG